MLYDIEPSSEVTGGPWFSDNELDSEFINGLMKACFKFIYSRSFPRNPASIFPASYQGYATLESVHRFIIESGICTIDLSADDILCLLEALEYDGKIIQIAANSSGDEELNGDISELNFMYKARRDTYWPHAVEGRSIKMAYMDIPCSVCPVVHECTDAGPISPPKCDYLKKWIEMI
jgi:DNA-directed RNA polymerase III subunit RPC6